MKVFKFFTFLSLSLLFVGLLSCGLFEEDDEEPIVQDDLIGTWKISGADSELRAVCRGSGTQDYEEHFVESEMDDRYYTFLEDNTAIITFENEEGIMQNHEGTWEIDNRNLTIIIYEEYEIEDGGTWSDKIEETYNIDELTSSNLVLVYFISEYNNECSISGSFKLSFRKVANPPDVHSQALSQKIIPGKTNIRSLLNPLPF